MTADPLYVLLVLSLSASILCGMLSMAMVGRKMADLDYQRAAGLNGTSRIQGVVNLRTHTMRVFVGVTFSVFAILLLAEAPQIWRQWVNRTLFVLVPAGYALATVLDWVAEREQQRIEIAAELAARAAQRAGTAQAEDQRLAVLQADRDSYRQMADEAVARFEEAVRTGLPTGQNAPPPLAPVVPEHNSPTTPEAAADAERQTLRARLTAAGLAAGQEPRTASEPEASGRRDAVDVESIQSGAADDIVQAVRRADQTREDENGKPARS